MYRVSYLRIVYYIIPQDYQSDDVLFILEAKPLNPFIECHSHTVIQGLPFQWRPETITSLSKEAAQSYNPRSCINFHSERDNVR